VAGIRLDGENGLPQRSCTRLPTAFELMARATGLHRLSPRFDFAMSGWDHASTRQVDHVIGAFYLVRRAVFAALGGLDERFFVYLEDLDFSARVAAAGYSCWYLASASAFHKGGGTSESVKARRLAYSLHSRLLYARKHFDRGAALAVAAATLCAEPFIRALVALVHCSFQELGEVAEGYRILWTALFRARRHPGRVTQ
jgi:GT2 family glycosyltransferase